VRFVHRNGAAGRKYLPETLGPGVAVLDFDGDGRMDLYFTNATGWPGEGGAPPPGASAGGRLFRDRGDGTFEDATERAGLADDRFALGAAAADYDGDGDTDLFVTAVGKCALWRNDGGRFTEVAEAAGVAGDPWKDAAGKPHDPVCTSAAFLAYDGDCVLDLFVCRYCRWSRETDVFTTLDGTNKAYTVPEAYPGDSGRLYRGRGDGTFEDATDRARVRNDDAKALGVAACDLDGDGDTDLVVANDTQPNHLWENLGDGTFREVGLLAGIGYNAQGKAMAGMGVDAACVDDGGAPCISIGNFSREPVSLYRRVKGARGLAFTDDGGLAGIAGPTFSSLTFGLLYQDFDLNGALDLLLANGHIEPTIQAVQRDIPYAQLPQLLRNLGNGRFEEVGARAGPAFGLPCVGRGLAWADLDRDGDPDAILTVNGGAARILRNAAPAGRRSLRLRLEGPGKNRDAFGAKVTVVAGGRTLTRERAGGGSYLSSSEPTLLFGLGTAAAAEKVEVRWPGKDGKMESFGALSAGLWHVKCGHAPKRVE